MYMSRAPATATAAVMAAVRPDGTDEDMVAQQMHTNTSVVKVTCSTKSVAWRRAILFCSASIRAHEADAPEIVLVI